MKVTLHAWWPIFYFPAISCSFPGRHGAIRLKVKTKIENVQNTCLDLELLIDFMVYLVVYFVLMYCNDRFVKCDM